MEEIKLYPFQMECVEGLRAGIRAGHRAQILAAPTGAGKCLGRDTPVLMANGSTKMVQDVAVGDQLLGPDGRARNVLSVTSGRELLYRVTPVKGDQYVVNASHILSLKRTGRDVLTLANGVRVLRNDDVVNVNVEVYARSNATARHSLKGWRSPAIETFAGCDDYRPIPPYILGAWLGDGTQGRAAISKPYCNLVKEWVEFGRSIGYSVRRCQPSEEDCPTWYLRSGLRDQFNLIECQLDTLGVLRKRFIPPEYKFAPLGVRLELLAGLIDSDGHVSHGGCDWISASEELAHDFAFLCRSVGLACYVTKQQKSIRSLGFTGWYWRASVSGDLSEIPMRDKAAPGRRQRKRHLVHGISVKPVGDGEYFGFEIDGDRLFLLGDFTVTHNTVIAAYLCKEAHSKGSPTSFIVDRVSLVDQTSAVFDRFGVPHGIIQADNERRAGWEPIQICSAQTIEKRGFFPNTKLVIVDECHSTRKAVADLIKNTQVKAIGLTATPFTRGLGEIYSNVVNVTTTNDLIAGKYLVPLKMYAAKAIDMTGAKVVAGEWTDSEIEARGMEIIGDIVNGWAEQTNAHFGGPAKTIVFAASVDHGAELCSRFQACGYNFQQISYRDGNDDRRRELIAEFRKPNSVIDGLVACEVLSRGFDVTDVMVGISARPYRKSLSSHIQQMGRVMRSHPGKEFGLWLDHSGNALRFRNQTEDVFENGVGELSEEGLESKAPREPTDEEKAEIRCAGCGFVLQPAMKVCPSCGRERVRRSLVEAQAGVLVALGHNGKPLPQAFQNKVEVWHQLIDYSMQRKPNAALAKSFALAQFKNIYGQFPEWGFDPSRGQPPTDDVIRRVRANLIRYAKGRAKGRLAA